MSLELSIDTALLGKVRLGVVALEGVTVRAEDASLRAEIDRYAAEVRGRHADVKSGDVPGVADARVLYKSLGIDPTKTRPSNEALLRRVLKGEPLYVVNTLVDALNLCSLRHQLPFGLYDAARVVPPILLRRGAAAESYEGIRKGPVGVEGRPVLADTQGPFGNPTSDSARTCITLETQRAIVVTYAPTSYAWPKLEGVVADTSATLTRFCGGREQERRLIPGP